MLSRDRDKIPGSKWWKVDFHTHTPASEDYGKGINQTALKSKTTREWLLDYMRAKIDCVVVTDHNSGDWIDILKDELTKMRDETPQPEDYRELYLFPGVEISVNGGIHLLAILDKDKGKSDIDRLLGAVGFLGTKGKSDDVTTFSFIQVIKIISELCGMGIPAHVDDYNGLFKEESGTTLKQILKSKNISAIELINLNFKNRKFI